MRRYNIFRLGLLLLTGILVLTSCSAKKQERNYHAADTFTAYVATDIHYFAPELMDDGSAFRKYVETGDSKQLELMNDIMQAFIRDISLNKPELLIVSGDVSNNGERKSHEQLASMFQQIEELGTEVYVIPGNHDILNPWSSQFKGDKQVKADYVTPEQFSEIYKAFGYDEAVSRDSKTQSYMAAPAPHVRLLMLDTCLYRSNERLRKPELTGIIPSSTQRWIREVVKEARKEGADVLPVMHHNLLSHNDLSGKEYQIINHQEIVSLFQELNLPLVLSGHVHLQHISATDEAVAEESSSSSTIYDVATSALSVYPHQYGFLRHDAKEQSWKYFTVPVEVEKWAKHTGAEDNRLLSFNQYAKQYFEDFTRRMVREELLQEHYSHDEMESMSEFMVQMNNDYFAGKPIANREQLLLSDAYELWTRAKPSYLKGYVVSMLQPYKHAHNEFMLKIEK